MCSVKPIQDGGQKAPYQFFICKTFLLLVLTFFHTSVKFQVQI